MGKPSNLAKSYDAIKPFLFFLPQKWIKEFKMLFQLKIHLYFEVSFGDDVITKLSTSTQVFVLFSDVFNWSILFECFASL